MKLIFSLAVLAAVAFGNSIQPYAWTPEKEYTYLFTSQVLTGLPQINNQYSGLKIQTHVRIQTFGDYSLRIKFEEPKFVTFNERIERDEDGKVKTDRQHMEPIPEDIRKSLEQPFLVHQKRGVFESVFVEESEPVLVTNIKKSLLSQLQMDLSASQKRQQNQQHQSSTNDGPVPEGASFFSTTESSLLGDCQTEYTIHPLPRYLKKELESQWESQRRHWKQQQGQQQQEQEEQKLRREGEQACQGKDYYQVTKYKNMDNCRQRPIYTQVTGFQSICDTSKNSCKNQFSHISTSTYIICGTPQDFYIRKANTKNKITLNPMGWNTEEKTQFTSLVTLELLNVQQIGQPLSKPQQPKEKQSLTYEYPSGHQLSTKSPSVNITRKEQDRREQKDGIRPVFPMPDLKSAPQVLIPRVLRKNEAFQQVQQKMNEIAQEVSKSPNSCSTKDDVAGSLLAIAQVIRTLSTEDIKELEQQVLQQQSVSQQTKEVLKELFYDVVAMSGTNPSVMFIKEKILSQQLQGQERQTKVLQNTIRNVRTPTEELLKELLNTIKTLKSQQQHNHQLWSTALLQLSDLVYRSYVDPSSSVSDYPVYIYGKFGSPDSQFIEEELIPYLKEQLENTQQEQSSKNSIIFISSLGKLGHEKAMKPLLKVAQGYYNSLEGSSQQSSTVKRSLAVYSLKRVAKQHPSKVRPLILSIIDNIAENPEVRMAAVSVLPFSQPSTADLQKIAVRSWFEPSKQVTSFIYSTLKSLKDTQVPELKYLGQQVKNVWQMVKPSYEGVQFSQNVHLSQFIKYLKTVSNTKIQTVSTEKSAIPSKLTISSNVMGGTWKVTGLELSVYTQGMDYLLEKLMDPQSENKKPSQQVEEQLKKINNELNIKLRSSTKSPEAHIQLKSLGLERIFTFDNEWYQQVVHKVTQQLRSSAEELKQGKNFQFTSLSLLGSVISVGPTESGFPIYMEQSLPLVMSVKGSYKVEGGMKIVNDGSMKLIPSEVEAEIIPVTNLKMQTSMGVVSPFTKQYLAVGVDMSIHSSTPIKSYVQYNRHGQLTIKLSSPEESQKEIELFHLNVRPYTVKKSLSSLSPPGQSSTSKTIIDEQEGVKEYSYDYGKYMDVDGKLLVKTNYRFNDLASLWNRVKEQSVSSMLEGASAMIPTVRRSSIKFTFNPSTSENKEIVARFTLAQGRKTSESSDVEISFPSEKLSPEKEIEKMCTENNDSTYEIEQCKEQERRKTESGDYSDVDEQTRRICQKQQSQSDVKSCLKYGQICEDTKRVCEKRQRQQQKSQEKCQEQKEECKSRLRNAYRIKEMLQKLQKGQSMGLTIETGINTRFQKRSSETQVSLGQKREGRNIKTVAEIKTKSSGQETFEVDLQSELQLPKVQNKWNKDNILQDNMNLKFDGFLKYGMSNKQKQEIEWSSSFVKSDSQKNSVRQSAEFKKCSELESQGKLLAPICMEARHQAASVDKFNLKLKVPQFISQSYVAQKFEEVLMAYYFAQHTQRPSSESSQPGELKIEASFRRDSEEAQLKWQHGNTQHQVEDIRLPKSFKHVLPLSLRNGILTRLVQKVTRNQAPESCRIESQYVSTFDNNTYSYGLNDCEHLIFKDCSNTIPIAVTGKGQGSQKKIKVLAGKALIEMQASTGSFSRSSGVDLKINGQSITLPQGQEQKVKDTHTGQYIAEVEHFLDGVMVVRHVSEMFEVAFDGERLEVVIPERLRNRACGLCGDNNGENTADVPSPGQCIFRKKRFSGYSYMMQSGSSCQGIPSQDKQQYEQELRQCTQKRQVPTPLMKIHEETQKQGKTSTKQHKVEVQQKQICISKQQLRVCPGHSKPLEVRQRLVSYICFDRYSTQAQSFTEKARNGEQVPQLFSLPTSFKQTEMEPQRCSKQYQNQHQGQDQKQQQQWQQQQQQQWQQQQQQQWQQQQQQQEDNRRNSPRQPRF